MAGGERAADDDAAAGAVVRAAAVAARGEGREREQTRDMERLRMVRMEVEAADGRVRGGRAWVGRAGGVAGVPSVQY